VKFNELETVRLLKEYPEKFLKKGDIGVVVMIYNNPNEAYEVEFINDDGTTKAMFVISPEDIEKW